MKWDDLRIFLAVIQSGSLKKAAKKLGMHHTSCARRLARLEESIGGSLFDRLPQGYTLTSMGHELLQSSELIRDEFNAIDIRFNGKDRRLEGPIKISMEHGFVSNLLMPCLVDFMEEHPGVEVDVRMTYDYSDLASREADLAIRHANAPPLSLSGKQVGIFTWAVYASREYLKTHDPINDPKNCRWIGWGKQGSHISWQTKRNFPDIPVVGNIFSEIGQLAAVQSNLGVGFLPCYLADPLKDVLRVQPERTYPDRWIWVLAHQNMMKNARVRALMDHLHTGFLKHKELLEGQRP